VPIALGSVTFDEAHTRVRERQEEVGGRDARRIEIAGLVADATSPAAIEARLDAILEAASADVPVALSVRPGRRLWVRRVHFRRELRPESLAGAFDLTLEAEDPFEESEQETAVAWNIATSGAQAPFEPGGTALTRPVLSLTAIGTGVNPAFSDGERQIRYLGAVEDGQTLVFDGPARRVTLDGADVTPYTQGVFPVLAPGGVTLTYTDHESSAHEAEVSVSWRDRWW
jgi:hypothetical protein